MHTEVRDFNTIEHHVLISVKKLFLHFYGHVSFYDLIGTAVFFSMYSPLRKKNEFTKMNKLRLSC